MKLKHINYVLKLINHININQKKKKLNVIYKKELLPVFIFLKKFSLIYKFIIFKKTYVLIFFKLVHNIFFLKKIKIFNYRLHNFKTYRSLFKIKKFNIFKFIFLFNRFGLFSIEQCLSHKLGGILILQLN